MEWARKLTAEDVKVLRGEGPYTENVPDVDEGFTAADIKDPKTAAGHRQGDPGAPGQGPPGTPRSAI